MKCIIPVLFFCSLAVHGQQYNYEKFLGLSPQQVAAVKKSNGEYADWTALKVSRIVQVDLELLQEASRSSLDPKALGVRYAELEVIRRERVDRLNNLRAQIQTYLTAAQIEKLKVLEDALKYPYEARDALCANYLAGESFGLCGRYFYYDPASSPYTRSLTEFLKITEEQEAKLIYAKGLWFENLIAQSEIAQQIWRRLCAAESAQPLIPESIGSSHVEVVLWYRHYDASLQQWAKEAKAVLTADQLVRLETLQQARGLLPIMQEAEQDGLLAIGPFGTVGSFPDNDSSINFKITSNFGNPNELSLDNSLLSLRRGN